MMVKTHLCLLLAVSFVSTAQAQFTHVIDIPPAVDSDILFGSTVQINVYPKGVVGPRRSVRHSEFNLLGGKIGHDFTARNGSTMNVVDGEIDYDLRAENGSTVNIQGGVIGVSFTIDGGSVVSQTGGEILDYILVRPNGTFAVAGGVRGDGIIAQEGSHMTVIGAEFHLNGNPIENLPIGSEVQINFDRYDVLSGTLADGTPFVLQQDPDEERFPGGLTIKRANVSPADVSVIHVSNQLFAAGIRDKQTIYLENGGELPRNFTAGKGSQLFVNGGDVGFNFESTGAEVLIDSGRFTSGLDAFVGTELTVNGGVVETFQAHRGSSVTLAGGKTGFGGIYGLYNTVAAGAKLVISGGVHSPFTRIDPAAEVTIVGNDFKVDGVPISDLPMGVATTVELPTTSLLRGVYSDGTPFVIPAGTYALLPAPIPTVLQRSFIASQEALPYGLRHSQSLLVDEGSVLKDGFIVADGSRVFVDGGVISGNLVVDNSEVLVRRGEVHSIFAYGGSALNFTGGTFQKLIVEGDAVLSGGTFDSLGGQKKLVVGGRSGSLNLVGTELFSAVNGAESPVDGLNVPGDSVIVDISGLESVTGTFLSGEEFAYTLGREFMITENAILRLTLARPVAFCDFDESFSCDVNDLNLVLAAESNSLQFDLDESGTVDGSDVALWLESAGIVHVHRPFQFGDVNLDGEVDSLDLNVIGIRWQTSATDAWSDGDLNGDGVVDVLDLNELAVNWKKRGELFAATTAVPEQKPSVYWCFFLSILPIFRKNLVAFRSRKSAKRY